MADRIRSDFPDLASGEHDRLRREFMLTEKIKALETMRNRVAELEREIAADLRDELARLPAQFGFSDTSSFVAALRRAAGGRDRGLKRARSENGRRKRVRITDAIRSRVRKMVEEGETGAAIAQRVGISLPSVQNIKSALGLVKRRTR